ncbi:hypothetical protein L2E82_36713 [Cichorium intybus]|uniref:Uncharacterized protein n=1 Tax=Cichorium intybus TaxID=13427 RepID=A0ACB9ADZ4_CICIN|nr:hypothetical protein L2E82_36713 [Cichorium intybus]
MSGVLSQGLIFEIFSRLPSKSLLRFKSLSKSIRSCIASPAFIRMLTLLSPKMILITHQGKHCIKKFYTFHSEDQFPLFPRRGYIGLTADEFPYSKYSLCVGSCDGILCIFDFKEFKEYNINLWNPSIRRKLTLPDCPASPYPEEFPYGVHRVGFGFHLVSDDYKIVSLPKLGRTGKPSYIYTMKTGAWCKIASPTPRYCEVRMRRCFVNGALHWVVFGEFTEACYCDYILTINLSTEVFGTIALPLPGPGYGSELTTIQGCLAVISINNDSDDNWIWVMREYNNNASWFVFLKSDKNLGKGPFERVLQATSDGRLFFYTPCEGFKVYDPKRGTLSRLQILDVESLVFDIKPIVESLRLLDIGTPCQGSQVSILEGTSFH